MLNPSYAIRLFQTNFSKIDTLKQVTELASHSEVKLEVLLIHRTPSVLNWLPANNFLTGEYHLLIYPKLIIEGKLFAPKHAIDVDTPKSIEEGELTFLRALKKAIATVEWQGHL